MTLKNKLILKLVFLTPYVRNPNEVIKSPAPNNSVKVNSKILLILIHNAMLALTHPKASKKKKKRFIDSISFIQST